MSGQPSQPYPGVRLLPREPVTEKRTPEPVIPFQVTCGSAPECGNAYQGAGSFAASWAAAVDAGWRCDVGGLRRCPECVAARRPAETLYVTNVADWPASALPPGLYEATPGAPRLPRPYVPRGPVSAPAAASDFNEAVFAPAAAPSQDEAGHPYPAAAAPVAGPEPGRPAADPGLCPVEVHLDGDRFPCQLDRHGPEVQHAYGPREPWPDEEDDTPYAATMAALGAVASRWRPPVHPDPAPETAPVAEPESDCPACGGTRSERFYVPGATGAPVTCPDDWHDDDAAGPGQHSPAEPEPAETPVQAEAPDETKVIPAAQADTEIVAAVKGEGGEDG